MEPLSTTHAPFLPIAIEEKPDDRPAEEINIHQLASEKIRPFKKDIDGAIHFQAFWQGSHTWHLHSEEELLGSPRTFITPYSFSSLIIEINLENSSDSRPLKLIAKLGEEKEHCKHGHFKKLAFQDEFCYLPSNSFYDCYLTQNEIKSLTVKATYRTGRLYDPTAKDPAPPAPSIGIFPLKIKMRQFPSPGDECQLIVSTFEADDFEISTKITLAKKPVSVDPYSLIAPRPWLRPPLRNPFSNRDEPQKKT